MCWQYLTNSIKMKTQKLTLCLHLKYMLQRTQTLFLLAIIVICGTLSTVNIPFYSSEKENGTERVEVSFNKTEMIVMQPMKHSVTEDNTLIISCLAIIGVLSIVSLLSFKNRKLQLLLTSLNFLAIGLLISLLYVFSLGVDYFGQDGTSSFKISLGLIVLIILFNLLAFRGIKKDEELIRSMDRLR